MPVTNLVGAGSCKSLLQISPRLLDRSLQVKIPTYILTPDNLIPQLHQPIQPKLRYPPLIDISHVPAALDQPKVPLAAVCVECGKDSLDFVPRYFAGIGNQNIEQTRQNDNIFHAESCAGAVKWRGCMGCIANDEYASRVELGEGIVGVIE